MNVGLHMVSAMSLKSGNNVWWPLCLVLDLSFAMPNHLILCNIHYGLSLILAILWATNPNHLLQLLSPFIFSIKPDLVW